jgi:hypothetical protein
MTYDESYGTPKPNQSAQLTATAVRSYFSND